MNVSSSSRISRTPARVRLAHRWSGAHVEWIVAMHDCVDYAERHTALEQVVVDAPHAVLVARDGARGENDDIARGHCAREKW